MPCHGPVLIYRHSSASSRQCTDATLASQMNSRSDLYFNLKRAGESGFKGLGNEQGPKNRKHTCVPLRHSDHQGYRPQHGSHNEFARTINSRAHALRALCWQCLYRYMPLKYQGNTLLGWGQQRTGRYRADLAFTASPANAWEQVSQLNGTGQTSTCRSRCMFLLSALIAHCSEHAALEAP